MDSKLKWAIPLALVSGVLVDGCSIGDAAKGPDPAEIEQRKNSLPPDQQIKLLQTSPMPAVEKAQKIKEIEDKYGVKAGAPPNTPGILHPAPG